MIKIGKIKIGQNKIPKLISEVSGNHGGVLSNAIKLIKLAAKNGTDLIKLQTYDPNNLTLNSNRSQFIIKDKKNLWRKNKLYDLYSKGQTLREWHYKIFQEARKHNVDCFSSVFDETDIEFLEKFKVPAYKISSFESTHYPLIEKVLKTKKPILISTGLNSLKELDKLVRFLRKKNCRNFGILKCTSSYPANSNDLNLATISDMISRYGCDVGFSDHSIGFNAAIGSIHQGASFIEKHICLNKKIGIDSKFSLKVDEIKTLKEEISLAYQSKGKIFYGPTKNELSFIKFRRSIYASKRIKKGEKFTKENIKIVRPAFGLEPKHYNYLLGKKSKKSISFASPIKWNYVKKSKKKTKKKQ
tara:strand:- start:686 stop:1759 length:1074 start_codon:yes stop_codon:yes gene_type:complete